MSWTPKISAEFAMGVQNLAEDLRSLAGWAQPTAPLADVHAILGQLNKAKRDIRRLAKLARDDIRRDAEERRAVARQVAKYRTDQLRIAHAAAMDASAAAERLRMSAAPPAALAA